jgi:hypothetical protein
MYKTRVERSMFERAVGYTHDSVGTLSFEVSEKTSELNPIRNGTAAPQAGKLATDR